MPFPVTSSPPKLPRKSRYAEAKIKGKFFIILHVEKPRMQPFRRLWWVFVAEFYNYREQRDGGKRQHVADSFERLGKIPYGELTNASPRRAAFIIE